MYGNGNSSFISKTLSQLSSTKNIEKFRKWFRFFDAYRMTAQRGQEEYEEVEKEVRGSLTAAFHSLKNEIQKWRRIFAFRLIYYFAFFNFLISAEPGRIAGGPTREGRKRSIARGRQRCEHRAHAERVRSQNGPFLSILRSKWSLSSNHRCRPSAFRTFLKIFMETFVLTFLAEWGDRSQVATVLLAATWDLLIIHRISETLKFTRRASQFEDCMRPIQHSYHTLFYTVSTCDGSLWRGKALKVFYSGKIRIKAMVFWPERLYRQVTVVV